MVIKPISWDKIFSRKSKPKTKTDEPPEPRIVRVQKASDDGSIWNVGMVMSNTLLGLNCGIFSVGKCYLGIAKIESLNQYALIHTNLNNNQGYAMIVDDVDALRAILERGKEQLLNEPEFQRLKELNIKLEVEK